ncbi:MAG: nicotinate phosphoribosyltransferase, partial [Butyricicoccus sp.]|nr:nicotinate phosphoribosyltransferase [Butyricicoccus sp.]
ELVYQSPSIEEIRSYCQDEMQTLWKQTLRLENPQTYYVNFSTRLWKVKHDLLENRRID